MALPLSPVLNVRLRDGRIGPLVVKDHARRIFGTMYLFETPSGELIEAWLSDASKTRIPEQTQHGDLQEDPNVDYAQKKFTRQHQAHRWK